MLAQALKAGQVEGLGKVDVVALYREKKAAAAAAPTTEDDGDGVMSERSLPEDP